MCENGDRRMHPPLKPRHTILGPPPPRCTRQALKEARDLAKAESKARAKHKAKEEAKEEQRDGKKISCGEKVRLEEALTQRFPGTPGLTGKEHSATGPKFLQALIKSKKDGNYDLPPWEERRALFGGNAGTSVVCFRSWQVFSKRRA